MSDLVQRQLGVMLTLKRRVPFRRLYRCSERCLQTAQTANLNNRRPNGPQLESQIYSRCVSTTHKIDSVVVGYFEPCSRRNCDAVIQEDLRTRATTKAPTGHMFSTSDVRLRSSL